MLFVRRAGVAADALGALADRLRQVPGRKNLVWLSEGFPISIGFDKRDSQNGPDDQRMFDNELERAANALNSANVAVYPINAEGLTVNSRFQPEETLMANHHGGQGLGVEQVKHSYDTLQLIASETGGKAFFDENDLRKATREALADSTVSYELTFSPSDTVTPGKFHKIKIKTPRRGVVLRYRKGYVTPKPIQEMAAANRPIEQILDASTEATAIGLSAPFSVRQRDTAFWSKSTPPIFL